MIERRSLGIGVVLAALLAPAAAAQVPASEAPASGARGAGGPDAPSAPRAVDDLVYARRFVLDEPYTYAWTRERPGILFGTLLVVKVDPELAKPRQVDVPVLYVGAVPAELANGHPRSDHRILIVPGEIDLARAPIFFGSTTLPERVDEAQGRRELDAARKAGIRPFSERTVAVARERGGAPLHVRDAKDLYVAVADLIDRYAPAERDVAAGYRAPRLEEKE